MSTNSRTLSLRDEQPHLRSMKTYLWILNEKYLSHLLEVS